MRRRISSLDAQCRMSPVWACRRWRSSRYAAQRGNLRGVCSSLAMGGHPRWSWWAVIVCEQICNHLVAGSRPVVCRLSRGPPSLYRHPFARLGITGKRESRDMVVVHRWQRRQFTVSPTNSDCSLIIASSPPSLSASSPQRLLIMYQVSNSTQTTISYQTPSHMFMFIQIILLNQIDR
jgi:hypothetical protein